MIMDRNVLILIWYIRFELVKGIISDVEFCGLEWKKGFLFGL